MLREFSAVRLAGRLFEMTKTVKNALDVLDLFLAHGDNLALEDMSKLTGLNKVTVRRMCLTLMESGYLRQFEKRGKYSLGTKLLDLDGTFKRNNWIIRIAAPHLAKLSQQANESVIMAIWDGRNAVHCHAVQVDHLLKAVPTEATILTMHNTSLGKAILAELPEEEVARQLHGKLERFTANTITDVEDLRNQLAAVKAEGVAYDDEEYDLGVRSIGAALKGSKGNVLGAVAIIGPSVRLTRAKLKEYLPLVKNCSTAISLELGFTVSTSRKR